MLALLSVLLSWFRMILEAGLLFATLKSNIVLSKGYELISFFPLSALCPGGRNLLLRGGAPFSALSIKPQGLNCCAMAEKREVKACFYFNKIKKVLLCKSEFHGIEIDFLCSSRFFLCVSFSVELYIFTVGMNSVFVIKKVYWLLFPLLRRT